MSNKPHRLHTRLERLEVRRHLSSGYTVGCSCAACSGRPDEPPVTTSADQDGSEARLMALRLAPPAPLVGPMPAMSSPGVTPQGVVGGTASTGRQPTGALTGKVVFTVGGHGFTAFTGGWHTQRGEVAGTEMVEDLGNQDQMTFYVNHLFNAGATVVPLRPVGYQPNEVLLDNDSPGVTYTGSWSNSTSTIFYGSPGDVPYRFAAVSAAETATARYTPNIPAAGFYPVYTWVKDDTDRINQLYRIAHTGGVTEVRVHHGRVGKGYVYLGTYHFNAGTGGYVEISNQGTNAGSSVVIADHIRFGNGMGDIDRGLGVSGQTRSDESALYWIEHQRGQGVADTVFRGPGTPDSDDDDNVSAPPRWAAHMNREQAGTNNEIFLSFHSNAGGGRGTVGLYNGNNDPAARTPFQAEWADLVARETRDDMFAIGSPPLEHAWNDRTLTWDRPDFEFGEINNTVIGNEFDATILEVAFHDSALDAALMRDPKVRDWVARASLQATIKYFNQFGSNANNSLPSEAPANVRAVTQPNGDVVVSWNAPPTPPGSGNAASGYVVYRSTNGYGFDNGAAVAGAGTLSLTIPAAQVAAGANYFRVSATNAGGESMPSETVAARTVAGAGGKILIVTGFDRLDRFLNPTQTTPLSYDPPFTPGTGSTFERVRPRFSNSYDYVVQAAEAIEAFSSTAQRFDTASNEAVIAGQVNLSAYAAVIWLAGEEGVANDTFNSTEQTLVTNYLSAGGKLFVSGSEIGFDLEASGNGAAFYSGQLGADYLADAGGSYTASGVGGSIFAGLNVTFDNGTAGTYNVNSPDRIGVPNGLSNSTVAMNYTGAGSGGAAIQYVNPNGGRVVYMAIPFETITTAANRNVVMNAVLQYFNLGAPIGSFSGRVVRDVNGDGLWGPTEIGLAGWSVFLDADNDGAHDPGEGSTTTNASGDYSFADVPAGPYNVRVVQQAGWLRTSPAGGVHVVNVTAGSSTPNLHFTQFRTTYTGSSGADEYTLKTDPANTLRVQIVEILSGEAPFTWSIAKSLLTTLSFDPGTGDDKLTIDHAVASPIPAGGVTFTGGANGPFAGDQLVIAGTAATDNVNATAGSVTTGGGVANYSGLERLMFNLLGGDDVVTVNAGASVTFNATQHLESLTLDGGSANVAPGGDKVIVTKSLDILAGGTLDLADNDLVINYTGDSSPMGAVMPWVVSGRNGGDWLGAAGIRSSVARDSGLTGLGVGEATQVFGLQNGDTAAFAGETVDATALLIKFTYMGDANLDGAITGDDYAGIDFNIAVPNADGYANGDFNYDGFISGDDYSVIDFNIVGQGPAL